jgi:iron-sulfur cluster repair protein YtfE (RIC family)
MKRNKSLYLLSHDHHHGLVEANRIVNIDISVGYNLLTNYKNDFLKFCNKELMKHFQDEEEILFPIYRKFSKENNPDVIEALKQHTDIRLRISELEITSVKEQLIDLLKLLGRKLKEHIRFEERQLFPAIEEIIPEDYLKQIEAKLQSSRQV